MIDPEAKLDFLERQIPELSAAATKVAYWRALSAGHSVLEAQDGVLYRVSPDGTRVVLKQIDKPTCVAIGTRFEIP